MEQVMKHYGNAILVIIVLLALGAILVAALTSDGYVATAFKEALTGFWAHECISWHMIMTGVPSVYQLHDVADIQNEKEQEIENE